MSLIDTIYIYEISGFMIINDSVLLNILWDQNEIWLQNMNLLT
jgi:hypothetical protein